MIFLNKNFVSNNTSFWILNTSEGIKLNGSYFILVKFIQTLCNFLGHGSIILLKISSGTSRFLNDLFVKEITLYIFM